MGLTDVSDGWMIEVFTFPFPGSHGGPYRIAGWRARKMVGWISNGKSRKHGL